MSWATVLPSRAPFHHRGADQGHGFRVVELEATRLAPLGQQGGGEQMSSLSFSRGVSSMVMGAACSNE
jgi:hypothetical protein